VYPFQSGISRFSFEVGAEMQQPPDSGQLLQLLESRMPWYPAELARFEWSGHAERSPGVAAAFGEGRVFSTGDAAGCVDETAGVPLALSPGSASQNSEASAHAHCGSRSVAFTIVWQYCSWVSQLPPQPSITRATKLSEVRRLLSTRKPKEGRARMVRSIQQSMRVEGYEVSTEVVANAVDEVFRSRRTG
jgi:hypothetical protein